MAQEEEKFIEVQKNYSEEIISEIQHAIDSNSANIKILSNIDEFPRNICINIAKISLVEINGKYDSRLFLNVSMNKEETKRWKTESVYRFYQKDWKRLNKNINIFDNNNYIEVSFKVKDANFIVLLRRVDLELVDDTFALMEYGEISYNNAQYTIIKAFSPSIKESYSTRSMLENDSNYMEKMYDNYGSEIIISNGNYNISEDDTNIDIVPIDELSDAESEELF